ncbi:MAG: universal stress protein, partial [Pseudomonadota bacterium]
MAELLRKRILLPVDGSNQSFEAVLYAAKALFSQKTEFILFHVLGKVPDFLYDLEKEPQPNKEIPRSKVWETTLKKAMQKFLGKVHLNLLDAGIPEEALEVKLRVRKTGIARDILSESRRNRYDAVVVGRTGLSKFKGFLMGSIANKLIEKLAHIPLCVVGGKPETDKIVLALDESEGAMRAVEFVAGLMDPSKFEVMLLHVVRDFNIYEKRYGNLFSLNFEEEWRETGKSEMESLFKVYRTHLINSGFDPKRIITKIITRESTRAGAIIHEAGAGGYGTIVMGR